MIGTSAENTRTFNVEIASALGLHEAIILSQVDYWLGKYMNDARHKRDGRIWVYNPIRKWHEQFPYISDKSVIRAFNSLRKKGILLTGNYNKMRQDRTIWYSIDYDKLEEVLGFKVEHKEVGIKSTTTMPKIIRRTTNFYEFPAHELSDQECIDIFLNPDMKVDAPIDFRQAFNRIVHEFKGKRGKQFAEYINSMNYHNFLNTLYWNIVSHRKRYKIRKCAICGSRQNLQVHHLTYENHGYEHRKRVFDNDLQVLCQDCHSVIHGETQYVKD